MLVLLPLNETPSSLSELENKISVNGHPPLPTSNIKVKVYFPRMKIEMTIEVKEALKKMGVIELFDDKNADLSRFCNSNASEDPLYVNSVVHKAFLEVNN